jgi:hypothetical protein
VGSGGGLFEVSPLEKLRRNSKISVMLFDTRQMFDAGTSKLQGKKSALLFCRWKKKITLHV